MQPTERRTHHKPTVQKAITAPWRHKYHIVFCPKYRYRILKEAIGEYVRQQVYQLCQQKEEIEVLVMNIQPDHVHLVVSIPPKYAVSAFMGYMSGFITS